ncbi:MAG: anti-sigma factor antagonist [Actinoplanes sp.]
MTVPFEVTKHCDSDGVTRLRVRGELDRDVSEALTAVIGDAAEQYGVTELIVDLEEVTFLAAAGLHGLVLGRAVAVRRGYPYRVVNARGIVRRVLEITGLRHSLDSVIKA